MGCSLLDAPEIVNYCQGKKEGTIPFVTIKGEKYYVGGDKLDLGHFGITDISEIKGLEKLAHLRELNLKNNDIKEIKGLDALTNLRELDLSANGIDEIKGLDNLNKLDHLFFV
jgi:internalin A